MDSLLDFLAQNEGEQPGPIYKYVDLILPLPLAQLYTYAIPLHWRGQLRVGQRVEVPFGRNKLYSGLIYALREDPPAHYQAKPILDILDLEPLVEERHLAFWAWLADYYLCTLGEVMQAALPAGLKLSSETLLVLHPDCEVSSLDFEAIEPRSALLLEQLAKLGEMSLAQAQEILGSKHLQKQVQALIHQNWVCLKEELKQRYKPKTERMIRLAPALTEDEPALRQAFADNQRSKRRSNALIALVQAWRKGEALSCKAVYEQAGVDSSILRDLVNRGLAEFYEQALSRLKSLDLEAQGNYALSEVQRQALDELQAQYASGKSVVLLHGVTGSGKTQIFVELIEQALEQGRQVLYLLPEIALTTQLVNRLRYHFGDKVLVYHSRFGEQERVELWQQGAQSPIILGARSALFLPYRDLGLILVDEEHDASYKQQDPAPRYNARDAAIFLAHQHKAKVLLGTATPSLETYQNVLQGKFGLVELMQRHGGLELPEVFVVDVKEETKLKRMKSHFSPQLIEAMQQTLSEGKQVILFQNRRGYAPMYRCNVCAWTVQCTHCDVSLTYHKYQNELRCHYCGHRQPVPPKCGACGSVSLSLQGFGTEKVEDELGLFFPEARIARLDWDSVQGKLGLESLIQAFEERQIDILVGTQMLSKGLDFDHVGLVGILSADQMLFFPDFRASERAFQLMTQVSGRAGRKGQRGKVLIQAFQPSHPVLDEVRQQKFEPFLKRELLERQTFQYPPFYRLIHIQLRHPKEETVVKAAEAFAQRLRQELGHRVLGPASPGIARIRNYYLRDLVIKTGRNSQILGPAKAWIRDCQDWLRQQPGCSQIRIVVDVDPV